MENWIKFNTNFFFTKNVPIVMHFPVGQNIVHYTTFVYQSSVKLMIEIWNENNVKIAKFVAIRDITSAYGICDENEFVYVTKEELIEETWAFIQTHSY